MIFNYLLLFFLIFLISAALTALVRKYSLKNALIDVPNERSSHSESTPRGGGLGIVLLLLAGLIYLYVEELLSFNDFLSLSLPILMVSVCGWVDDHGHVHSGIRLFVYALSTICFFLLSSVSDIQMGIISTIIWLGFILWMINLFNFMDGIDAIASIETLSTAAFAILLFGLEDELALMIFSMIIFAATSGFLVWNWPPARIFMGDVASCTLGFVLAVLTFLTYEKIGLACCAWFILLSVFITDSTMTLLKRLIKRDNWYSAHKQHAYQLLVQTGWSHRKVVLSILAINLLYLWPLAYYAYVNVEYSYIALIIAYVPIIFLWWYINEKTKNKLAYDTSNEI